jgi:hypothetical protein
MLRLDMSTENREQSKNNDIAMWTSSAQVADKQLHGHSISSLNKHSLGRVTRLLVHKPLTYTRLLALFKTGFYPLPVLRNNRLDLLVIPTMHRAYIQNKNFKLMII